VSACLPVRLTDWVLGAVERCEPAGRSDFAVRDAGLLQQCVGLRDPVLVGEPVGQFVLGPGAEPHSAKSVQCVGSGTRLGFDLSRVVTPCCADQTDDAGHVAGHGRNRRRGLNADERPSGAMLYTSAVASQWA
jgi:hypothetical protein